MLPLRSVGRLLLVVLGLCIVAAPTATRADLKQEGEAEADTPLPWQFGPKQLALGHGVAVDLPSGYQFLGLPAAADVMTQMGNLYNDGLLGLIVPSQPEGASDSDRDGEQDSYLITLRYDEEGYIKDDEELDGEELLSAIREGEAEYNEERKQAGFPAIHAEGWQEAPRYDRARHELIWALLVSSADDDPQADRTVNYSTRVLGRKGYVSVNLVTDSRALEAHKPAARAILAATGFVSGQRYEDFDSNQDKVAEYGLTGLVLGGVGLGAAKLAKVGLLAKFGKLIIAALIAGKKAIAALLIAAAAGLRKFFGRRKERVSQV